MEESTVMEPELVGRQAETERLRAAMDAALAGSGSTFFISGEAGVGKTRLVSEAIRTAESMGFMTLRGRCLAESMEPLMPMKNALREAGLLHLMSGDPPPLLVSSYLFDNSGIMIVGSESRETGLDSHIFSSMLKAVGDFVKDSMRLLDGAEKTESLNTLGYGDFKILIEAHESLHLACVTKGGFNEQLVTDMREGLSRIWADFRGVLENWNGDMAGTEGIGEVVSGFVGSGKYTGRFLVDDPKLKQENLFDNVLMGLQRASLDKPILLFLDDIHWSDPSTLKLLHYVARNMRKHHALILATYRPEDIVRFRDGVPHQLETAMQNMGREDLLESMELKRLDILETGKLILSALGNANLDANFINRVQKETEGNPFFVLEVMKLLVEEGAISQDRGGWKLSTNIEHLDIPVKIYDVVRRRLGRLMKEQREILECASVVGTEFSPDILAAVTAQSRLALLKSLNEIEINHRLIHCRKDAYQFDHAKIREVLYNDISDVLRREYHRLIGDTIAYLHEENIDEAAGELAHHYYEAADGKAGAWLVKAGDIARDRFAIEETIRLYTNASETITDVGQRIAVLEKLGDIQAITGEYDSAIESFQTAKEELMAGEIKARILRKIADVHMNKGDFDKSLKVLAAAEELLTDINSIEFARLLLGKGYSLCRKGDYNRAMPLLQEAVRTFEKVDAGKDMGNNLRAIGNIYLSKADFKNSLEYYQRSLAEMKRVDDKPGIAAALNNIGVVHSDSGELGTALEFYEPSLDIRKKIGDKQGIAYSLNNIGNVHRNRGQSDRALEFLESSLKILERIGDKRGIAISLNNIALVHRDMGDLHKALKFHESSLNIRKMIGDMPGTVDSLCGIAETELELGNLQRATEHAENAASIALEVGTGAEQGMSCRVLGKICRVRKDYDRARNEFERAKKMLEFVGDKQEPARLLYDYGLLWVAKGESSKAKESLSDALAEFERMGMRLWAERCREALGGL